MGSSFPFSSQKPGVTEEHMGDSGSGSPEGVAYFLAGCYQRTHSDAYFWRSVGRIVGEIKCKLPAVCGSDKMVPGFDQEKPKRRGLAGTTLNCKKRKTFNFGTTFICAV